MPPPRAKMGGGAGSNPFAARLAQKQKDSRKESQRQVAAADAVDESTLYMSDKVMANEQTIYKIRVFVAVTAGLLVGVMGLSGLNGFLAYFTLAYAAAAYLHFMFLRQARDEFLTPAQSVFSVGGIMGGLVTFIIMWTLAYDTAYVF
eukprot:TRINITY_DN56226_c0_g1_i1.p1 TRINITY_DN56226_c0_g1~~TRINITY_DN56226_c0_g1_i1.p1  ORF type:complete len:147 (+),score=57.03 TRINITY_DN56226_c0_g1_i1:87-527(+)